MDGILSLFKRLPMASQVNKKKIQSLYDQFSLPPIHCFAKLISWPPPSCSLRSSCNDPLVISHACQAGYLLLILILDYFPPDTSVFLLSIPSLCAKITFTNRFSLALCSNISPPHLQQHTSYIGILHITVTHTHTFILSVFFPENISSMGANSFYFIHCVPRYWEQCLAYNRLLIIIYWVDQWITYFYPWYDSFWERKHVNPLFMASWKFQTEFYFILPKVHKLETVTLERQ